MKLKNPKKTLRERLWEAVQKHPGCTAKRLAEILGETGNISVNPALATMKRQGITYSVGSGSLVSPMRWYTMYKRFPVLDELPLVVDHNCKKALPEMAEKILAPSLYFPNSQLIGFQTNGEPQRIDKIIGELTMIEAQEIYQRLHGYFGVKPNALVN